MEDDALPEADRLEGAPHPRHTPSLYGQEAAEAAFLQAYASDRLHHGWLLTGPRGVGKATLAWRIARFLLEDAPAGLFGGPPESLEIAPDAPVFRRTSALAEPRLALCRRAYDEKAKRLKTALTVDEVRKLKAFFALSAADGGWRVAIVDAVDEMNTAAANALLKILEEPPEKAILLLVCHRPARVLPTIRSRCRTLRLGPLDAAPLAEALRAAGQETPLDDVSAVLAEGSVGEALRLASRNGAELYRQILGALAEMPGARREGLIGLSESAAGRGAEETYDLLLTLTTRALARIARHGAGGGAQLLPEEAEAAARLCPDLHAAQGWAALLQDIEGRAAHGRAVNLDPAQVVLDMWLAIDRQAHRATA